MYPHSTNLRCNAWIGVNCRSPWQGGLILMIWILQLFYLLYNSQCCRQGWVMDLGQILDENWESTLHKKKKVWLSGLNLLKTNRLECAVGHSWNLLLSLVRGEALLTSMIQPCVSKHVFLFSLFVVTHSLLSEDSPLCFWGNFPYRV